RRGRTAQLCGPGAKDNPTAARTTRPQLRPARTRVPTVYTSSLSSFFYEIGSGCSRKRDYSDGLGRKRPSRALALRAQGTARARQKVITSMGARVRPATANTATPTRAVTYRTFTASANQAPQRFDSGRRAMSASAKGRRFRNGKTLEA